MKDPVKIFRDIVAINKVIVENEIHLCPPVSQEMGVGYREYVKPLLTEFNKEHSIKRSEFFKSILQHPKLKSNNNLKYRFFGNWGHKVNPFIWATIYCDNNLPKPASHSGQLYLLVDHRGLKFGFSYGDSIKDTDLAVASITNNINLHETILKVVNDQDLLVVNHGAGEASFKLDGNVKDNLLKTKDDFTLWNKDIHLFKTYPGEDIPPTIVEEIIEVLHSLLPLVDVPTEAKSRDSIGYWLYSPGEGARNWDEEFANGYMTIDFGFPDDLSEFQTKSDLEDVRTEYGYEEGSMNTIRALWDFSHAINVGDIVIAKKGRGKYLGYGVIESDYQFEGDNSNNHIRKINWLKKGNWPVESGSLPVKTLTNITEYDSYVDSLKVYLGIDSVQEIVTEEFDMDKLLSNVFLSSNEVANILDLLGTKKNIILQGSAGVGKTFLAKKIAKCLQEDYSEDRIEVIQFHQSYSYEDFIQGYRPTEKSFELRNGIFYELCQRAKADISVPYFLIIDEINRGNLSKIFGELMMLIETDKRGERNAITLTYSKADEKFYVPDNLYIIGTMNTADRSLTIVDYALRRRFAFIKMNPNFGEEFISFLVSKGVTKEIIQAIVDKMRMLNEIILNDDSLGEGFEIGHSYFCSYKSGDQKKWFENVIKYEIIPLIDEYWFDDRELASQHQNMVLN
jgi:MoxR-like ATPase